LKQFHHSDIISLKQPLQHSIQRRGQNSHTIFTSELQCKTFS